MPIHRPSHKRRAETTRTNHKGCYRDRRRPGRLFSSHRFQKIRRNEDCDAKKNQEPHDSPIKSFKLLACMLFVVSKVLKATVLLSLHRSVAVATEMRDGLCHSHSQSQKRLYVFFFDIFAEVNGAAEHLMIHPQVELLDSVDGGKGR